MELGWSGLTPVRVSRAGGGRQCGRCLLADVTGGRLYHHSSRVVAVTQRFKNAAQFRHRADEPVSDLNFRSRLPRRSRRSADVESRQSRDRRRSSGRQTNCPLLPVDVSSAAAGVERATRSSRCRPVRRSVGRSAATSCRDRVVGGGVSSIAPLS